MRQNTILTKKEVIVVLGCIVFVTLSLIAAGGHTRRHAKDIVCQVNLKQWGLVFSLYAGDNNSSFPQSHPGDTDLTTEQAWFLGATLPYYESQDMWMCPATTTKAPGSPITGGVFKCWGPFPLNTSWWDSYAEGSYGFNEWCADPVDYFWGLPLDKAIRKTYDQNAWQIPLMGDSAFLDTAPEPYDNPPTDYEHQQAYKYVYPPTAADWHNDAMKFYAINRHNQGINMVFADMHAQHVDIKQLWRLKWHQNFDMNTTILWPSWLDDYPDY